MALATIAFMGCESDTELENISPSSQNMLAGSCDNINFEDAPLGETITEVYSTNGMGPIKVNNMARNPEGVMLPENRAMIFDTRNWTGDDSDLYTPEWGKALIIQEIGVSPIDDPNVANDGPNDNQWGGQMELTFPEAVTLSSMKVLDIDTYEDDSWVYLYDKAGKELFKYKLKPLGNNSRQTVEFGNTANVMKMKVVLAGLNSYSGSGAIDDIMFCVAAPTEEEPTGCTRTQGYWKNHADPNKKKYDSTWDEYLNKDFYGMGDYLAVLKTAPKGGNADIILAHQYIAAELNMAAGASAPDDVEAVMADAHLYFSGELEVSRDELISWAELLDDYNNGKIGPGHCDE